MHVNGEMWQGSDQRPTRNLRKQRMLWRIKRDRIIGKGKCGHKSSGMRLYTLHVEPRLQNGIPVTFGNDVCAPRRAVGLTNPIVDQHDVTINPEALALIKYFTCNAAR